jgi:hypothetical protein
MRRWKIGENLRRFSLFLCAYNIAKNFLQPKVLAMTTPKLLAMLIKQGIDGDDSLLRLAQLRYQDAALGAEFYPVRPEHLDHELTFRPADQPCTIHLPRDINLLHAEGRDRVVDFAQRCGGRVAGMIVHDHRQFAEHPYETLTDFRETDRRLGEIANPPLLFVEYAAGLLPEVFASLFERAAELRRVSACIDISHVGIQVCRNAYGLAYPGVDVCSLKSAPDLPDRLPGIQAAVAEALPAVLALVRRLTRLGKPLHFHLHDGHPLSTLSRYGVSDHLGFLQEIQLPSPYLGRRLIGGMFGPAGLRAIIQAALEGLPPEHLSFMIEVHPQEGRTPLGPHAHLFASWKDRANAERMNYWMDMLLQNAILLRDACANAGAKVKSPGIP